MPRPILFATAIAIVAVAGSGHALADWLDRVTLTPAGSAEATAAIQARGWYCPRAETIERTDIDAYGAKTYRIRCSTESGGAGPSYRLVVARDRRQYLAPWR